MGMRVYNLRSESRNPKSTAFTLVELLVVITIIGILIAMLLPAVQAAREAARRMQCQNNLKQTMLGLHMYHNANGVFPCGAFYTDTAFTSWMASILPFLEAENISRLYDPTTYYGLSSRAMRNKVSTYCCPSDNADREGLVDKANNGSNSPGFARSNVVGCFGVDGSIVQATSNGKRGLFAVRFPWAATIGPVFRSIANVTDGTSNTVAISEIISGPNNSGDFRGMWWDSFGCHYDHKYNPNSPFDTVWDYGTTPPMCDPSKVPCNNTAPTWQATCFAAGSYHAGGVNVGLVDGTVTFANETVDSAVWQAMGSINGGEIMSSGL
jgi:prepilin-type N-terminal cleavage/methylation domain-containing protein